MMFQDRIDYIQKTFVQESKEKRTIRLSTGISITPDIGRFLQFLIKASSTKTVIEVGTFSGYSALWMAEALPDDGVLFALEKDPERSKNAENNLVNHKNIRLVTGDAKITLSMLEDKGPFDMMFIDADKINYLHYLDWAEKNVKKGGLIVADNTFLFDSVWKDEPVPRVRQTARNAMRTFNLRLADRQKYTSLMLPTPEGLTIAVKSF